MYSTLALLAHLVSQSASSVVLLSMSVFASNLLILAHGRQNIVKVFLVNSQLPGCCLAKIAFRRRYLFVLYIRVWKLSTAVQCYQNFDKLLQVNGDVFVAKGYEHIWDSSGHRLKLAFCGCLNDVEARAYVRTASYAPDSRTAQLLVDKHEGRNTLLAVSERQSRTQAFPQAREIALD